MDIFRLIADTLHTLAILFLIIRIWRVKTSFGLSYRTQEMLLVTFCLRYIDIFLYFISLYNLLIKIFYFSATLFIIYLIRMKSPYCDKYKSSRDDFKHYYIIYPAALIMTLFIHTRSELIDLLWCYSLWLDGVAFVPQIIIFRKQKFISGAGQSFFL